MEVQLAPPSEPAELLAPITTEEALLDVPEAQTPTLMIQGVLGELVPGEELAEASGTIEEEEDSSSTPGKEDVEDGRATRIVQITDVPVGQLEVLPTGMQLRRVETIPQG